MLFYVLFVCKCLLPPGDKLIAVNKYINISITGSGLQLPLTLPTAIYEVHSS